MSYRLLKKSTTRPIGIGDLTVSQRKQPRRTKISPTPRQLQSEEDTARLLNQSFYNLPDSLENSVTLPAEAGQDQAEEGQLSVDIFQTDTDIIIMAPIAGVSQENISLSITDDILTIRGKRAIPLAVPDHNYFTQECFWGPFSRSIVLPPSIDKNSLRAEFKDGILIVRMPKTENVKTRIIKINS